MQKEATLRKKTISSDKASNFAHIIGTCDSDNDYLLLMHFLLLPCHQMRLKFHKNSTCVAFVGTWTTINHKITE